MLALDSWKKIEEVDAGRRLLGAMHHGCTYILICFYISVLADVFFTCLAISDCLCSRGDA